jgi:hypothetical protein
MKRSMSNFRLVIMLTVMLSFSAVANAQRGYHYDRHYSYHNSYHYVPARISSPFGYGPSYYYRPVYRPHYYRPIYRLPHFIHYGPAFGFRLGILPFGYSTIYVGDYPYYYNNGIYYRPYADGGYEVTAPPLGAEVNHLPTGAKATVIDGEKYYELGGTFYQEEISSGNRLKYKVVGTDGVLNTNNNERDGPVISNNNNNNGNNNNNNNNSINNNNNLIPATGSRVDQLPEGSKVVVINQQKYYLSRDGIYYREVIEGNSVRYEVTGTQAN